MKINIKDFCVPGWEKGKFEKWLTLVKSGYQPKKKYKEILG